MTNDLHCLASHASALVLAGIALTTAAVAPASAAPASRHLTLRDTRGVNRPALQPEKAALIIIDAQREYVDGRLQLVGMSSAVAEIARLRRWAHAHGVPVVHIQQVSPPSSTVFAKGSQGAEIVADLTPSSNETVITKAYPNAFNRTSLHEVLQSLGRRQVILTGFMAHMCLDSTARAAFDLDYDVFVVSSATAERAIPGPDGRMISAAELRRATMAALNDRFAWVIADAPAVELEAQAAPR